MLNIFALMISLSSCDMVDKIIEDKKEPALTGDRISILLNQRTLTPDPKLAKVKKLKSNSQSNSSSIFVLNPNYKSRETFEYALIFTILLTIASQRFRRGPIKIKSKVRVSHQ